MDSATGSWGSIRLRQLEYLDAVGRLGHFGDAADAVGVSQPTLSQGLARLEQVIGADLFVRAGRRRALTPIGKEMVAVAATIIRSAGQARGRMTSRIEGRSGRLTIGMIDAAALYLLRDQVDTFRDVRPDVDLRITIDASRPLLEALDAGLLDVAVVASEAHGFVTDPLVSEPLHVYGTPVDDLPSIDRWLMYPDASHTRSLIDVALAGLGIRPRIEAESGNPSVLAALVRMGVGWAVLPPGIAEAGPEPLRPVSDAIATRTLVAARTADVGADPLISGFLDALRSG